MEDFDINNLTQEKIKILELERVTRIKNVFMYQINLDNYLLSIKEIEENHSSNNKMLEFKQNLQNLVESTIVEQTKEKIILRVIENQLKGIINDNL